MNVQVAQRLAELRRARGYSQESLASELGLSRQAVSKWERAESSPDTENLIALAKLYGVSLDELVSVDRDVEEDIAFERSERARVASERAARDETRRAESTEAQRNVARAVDAAVQASGAAARAAESAAAAASANGAHDGRPRVPDAAEAGGSARKGRWRSFPISWFALALFLILAFIGSAKYALLVFFLIPIYRWIADIMDGAAAREANERKPEDSCSERTGSVAEGTSGFDVAGSDDGGEGGR